MKENNEPLNHSDEPTNLMDDLLANPFGEQQESSVPSSENKQVRLIDVLPEENKEKAYQLAKQIDPTNHQTMITYGAPAQAKLHSFSNTMLDHVKKKDTGQIGEIIGDLMRKL